jgi:CRISPR/Cas system CSM-associated protein Csm4 (group 5 of RAMP superfamily)
MNKPDQLTISECEAILDNLRRDMKKNEYKSDSSLFYISNINFVRKKLNELLKQK